MRINILEYLEDTAARVPEKLAFSTGKEGMTFSEVQSGAASIGSYIANKGIYREPIVIFMDKHPATVTAFFGVIYSGNFYVCLDEKMPDARILAIVENLRPRMAIADKKNIERAKKSGVKYVVQPGGSIRDDLVIECADKYGMAMAFTGMRLFHH